MIADLLYWVLVAIILLAAAIGLRFLTRGTAVRRVRRVDMEGGTVPPSDAGFPALVALLTGGVLAPGNRVELALNGDGTYERLWADLRAATRSVTVQMYYAQPGRVADRLRDI